MHKGYLCCPLNKGNGYLCPGKLIPSPKGLTSTAKRLVQHHELAETQVSRKVQEHHQYENLLAEVESNNTLNARINCPPEKESTHVHCVPKIRTKREGKALYNLQAVSTNQYFGIHFCFEVFIVHNIQKPEDLEVIGYWVKDDPNTVRLDIELFTRGNRRKRLES